MVDLPVWVQSVVKEEWTAEVFDVELIRLYNLTTEMSQMLQNALACVEKVPDSRPSISEVVGVIELIQLLECDVYLNLRKGGEMVDLPVWVQSVVKEEWTAEVFDVELIRLYNLTTEMSQMLQNALACVEKVPDSRPSISEVVGVIELIQVEVKGDKDECRHVESTDDGKPGCNTLGFWLSAD
ncbi:putative inactive receptor kinase [Artemisia annua]|uniref:Putative inactive receptor kinase n=1 Tax=Artemisia annua TaxID=35608 RepID=A0A2U1LJG5_ARTAN|nr:putative inactive receptor kinase [Artemisia annua]